MMSEKQKSIPLRKSKFTFSNIELTNTEPKQVTVSLLFPGHLISYESTMTGKQFRAYGQFQSVIALEHGIQPYVVEVEQSRCSRQRALIWREFINFYLPELG
ncbi:hypothetical protein [uncultured Gimesia sp.]|uniref:hypothetical protein n=1 Tax=uncultured Gimesia sp. TaxID=1678688 RepID=UPI00261758CE|nr:hypothetical protein [uncultured Gimesia sp.]